MDRDRPLQEHLLELRQTLWPPLALGAVVFAVTFPFTSELVTRIIADLGLEADQLALYGPTELFRVRMRLAAVVAVAVALPWALARLYNFAAPGLYTHEQRFTTIIVPSSLMLFAAGAALGYWGALPRLLDWLLLEEGPGEMRLSLSEIFRLLTSLCLGLGLVFQLPLVIGLGLHLELWSAETLRSWRPYLYGFFLAVALLLAPDPSLMVQLMVMVLLIVLFEATLLVAGGRRKGVPPAGPAQIEGGGE